MNRLFLEAALETVERENKNPAPIRRIPQKYLTAVLGISGLLSLVITEIDGI